MQRSQLFFALVMQEFNVWISFVMAHYHCKNHCIFQADIYTSVFLFTTVKNICLQVEPRSAVSVNWTTRQLARSRVWPLSVSCTLSTRCLYLLRSWSISAVSFTPLSPNVDPFKRYSWTVFTPPPPHPVQQTQSTTFEWVNYKHSKNMSHLKKSVCTLQSVLHPPPSWPQFIKKYFGL